MPHDFFLTFNFFLLFSISSHFLPSILQTASAVTTIVIPRAQLMTSRRRIFKEKKRTPKKSL
ncbi:hypothetical protein IC582_023801 [Cucumis melo]